MKLQPAHGALDFGLVAAEATLLPQQERVELLAPGGFEHLLVFGAVVPRAADAGVLEDLRDLHAELLCFHRAFAHLLIAGRCLLACAGAGVDNCAHFRSSFLYFSRITSSPCEVRIGVAMQISA